MARSEAAGNSLTLTSHFYQNGVLFDPFTVDDVKIYDSPSGGSLITTITPVRLSVGTFSATWNIPETLAVGLYYDQWTWRATSLTDINVQRGTIQVVGSVQLQLASEEYLNNRLTSIEQTVANLSVAVNNCITKTQFNQIMVILQRMEEGINNEIALLKTRVTTLEM